MRISGDEELFACPCDRHVQFAVHPLSFGEYRSRQHLQLVRLAYGGAEQDHVTLASLVAFHRVDGNLFIALQIACRQFLADHGYLTAERYDDADLPCRIPVLLLSVQAVEGFHDQSRNGSFFPVHLVVFASFVRDHRNESQAHGGRHPHPRVISPVGRRQFPRLVGQGYQSQLVVVEHAVHEFAQFLVHAPLTVQPGHGILLRVHQLLQGVPPFEERVAAVGQSDGPQRFVVHFRSCRVLQHHGRQLFVVADQDEFPDGTRVVPV